MLPTTNQLPTLGYLHKIVCDCLGLWHSDNDDVTFQVPATEKERRKALQLAFQAIKKEDGTYGSFEEVNAATAQFAPPDKREVKKSRTIQAYVTHLSKSDFESVDEFCEIREYIEVLLTERYSNWGISELAVRFYFSALTHYREFVREHACNAQGQTHSLQCFLAQDLRALLKTLTRELLPVDAWPEDALDEPWPLKGFADEASQITGITLHKLHQYHEFQQEGPLNEQAWNRDFTGQQVNTRSKQVIDRLRRYSKMKWETFYPTLQPLSYHLPRTISEKAFAIHAFAAMLAHNINVQVVECGPFEPPVQSCLWNDLVEHGHYIPSSDLMDLHINGHTIAGEAVTQQAPYRYQAMLDRIRSLPGTLNLAADIPGSAELAYKTEHRKFIARDWQVKIENTPVGSPNGHAPRMRCLPVTAHRPSRTSRLGLNRQSTPLGHCSFPFTSKSARSAKISIDCFPSEKRRSCSIASTNVWARAQRTMPDYWATPHSTCEIQKP